MKIEVMVDKDNTHFSYKFDCDNVIDGTGSRATGPLDTDRKLVILKKIPKPKEQSSEDYEKYGKFKTVAVFNYWTFWRVIDNSDVIGYYQTLSGKIPLTQKILDKNPQMIKDEKCFIGPQHVDNLKRNI